jgi:3'(2'), 5'-bisphosphate nucleotidase
MNKTMLDLAWIESLLVKAVARATEAGFECRKKGIYGKAADRHLGDVIEAILCAAADYPVVCEEDASSHPLLGCDGHAFLVDPIDGTEGFDRGDPEFAHQAAFIARGHPVAAAIACPGYGWLFSGNRSACGVRLRNLAPNGTVGANARKLPAGIKACRRAVIGQSELTAPVLERLKSLGMEELMMADSAVAFGHLLTGNADIFLRTRPNRVWDVASGHALVVIQGGGLLGLDGAQLIYADASLHIRGFVAYSAAVWQGDSRRA